MIFSVKNEFVKKCNGCSACAAVCPYGCVKMTKGEHGFLYPVVEEEKCGKCGACERVCPVLNKTEKQKESKAYAIKTKDLEVRKNSSSGGFFSVLANWVLNQNGVVYGAAWNKDFQVVHERITQLEEVYRLRGSKYLQSTIGNCYKEAEKDIREGKKVLFTGTPCQIEGLLSYLNKDYENLITCDIICHGCPSPKVWEEYLDEKKKQFKQEEIVAINFRDKVKGWRQFSVTINFSNGEAYSNIHYLDGYMTAFLRNYILRDSCYDCSFKTVNRRSDFTMADLWGAEKIRGQEDDDMGISLVLVHSEKGEEFLHSLNEKIDCEKVDLNLAKQFNPSLENSCLKPKKRDKYLKYVYKSGVAKANKKFFKGSLKNKIKTLIKKLLRRK